MRKKISEWNNVVLKNVLWLANHPSEEIWENPRKAKYYVEKEMQF